MNRATREQGFTLVELVFGVTIMAIMVAAIGGLFLDNLQTVTLGKARAIGLSLATEKMEHLRDLPYDSLATQNGTIYPPGTIADNETVVRGSYTFTVHTDISYVDDPYDGYISCPCASGPAAGKPKDSYPYDYKKAQIAVKLTNRNVEVAKLTTDIAGKAAETSSNTGILSITVVNAAGQPIPNATVTIVNTNPNPDVNITTTTDNNGLVVVPKLPPDSNRRYVVTASFPGYSSEGTIADPPGAQTAVKLNPNVLAQQITGVNFAIDQLSTLYVHVTDTSGNPIPSLNVTTISAKKTMTTPDVFKYNQSATTNATGDITLSNMEWDSYRFTVPGGNYIVSASPYAPVALDPNSSKTVNLVVSPSSSWPRITTVDPLTITTGSTFTGFDVTGVSFASGMSLTLKKTGQSDINGTSCTVTGSTLLTCNLNLTGAAVGAWDVVVTKSGNSTTQVGGLDVTP